MRVGLVSGEYPPRLGGIADYSARLGQELTGLGHEVTIITDAESSLPGPPLVTVPGWEYHQLGALASVVRKLGLDVVHIQYQPAAYGMSGAINLAPLVLRAMGVRAAFVSTFHDLRVPFLFPKAGPFRPAAVRALIGSSNASIFVDSSDLPTVPTGRLTAWIPIAANITPSEPIDRESERRRLGIPEDALAIAFFGFINESKGVDTLLRAAQRLVRAGLALRLLFVGEEHGASDPTNVKVADAAHLMAEELGLTDLIVRTGALPPLRLSQALSAGDLAVLPFRDGASLRRGSLLACWAHGLPVVTTRPRSAARSSTLAFLPFGRPEAYAIDSEVAALVESGDNAALARAIFRLANDEAWRHTLSRAGLELADRLNWADVARATSSVYSEVVRRRRQQTRA